MLERRAASHLENVTRSELDAQGGSAKVMLASDDPSLEHCSDELSIKRAGSLAPLRPSGLPSTSSRRHGLTECNGPPHSAHRRPLPIAARQSSPIEMRGSQLIGLNLVTRHWGQKHWTCVCPSAASSSMVALTEHQGIDRHHIGRLKELALPLLKALHACPCRHHPCSLLPFSDGLFSLVFVSR